MCKAFIFELSNLQNGFFEKADKSGHAFWQTGEILTRRSVSYRKADVQSRISTFSRVLVNVPALCGSRISVDDIIFFDISIHSTYTHVYLRVYIISREISNRHGIVFTLFPHLFERTCHTKE